MKAERLIKIDNAAKWVTLMGAFPWHTDEPINGGDVVDFIANELMDDDEHIGIVNPEG